MERVRHLIVGAGITGLAYADRISESTDDYLVIEAEAEIGGYCRTVVREVELPEGRARFVWDFSGHFFHFRFPEIEAELVKRMGNERVLRVVRDARIYWPGARAKIGGSEVENWVNYPFQTHLHELPKVDFIECLVDLWEAEQMRHLHPPPSNFLEMLYQRFGKGTTERFLRPYNEKLYATDLACLDVDAMGRFFPHADLKAVFRTMRRDSAIGYNATFTYPEGGAIQYVRALASRLPLGTIALNEGLVQVDRERKIARTTRREIAFEHLVSTIPFVRLLEMSGLLYEQGIYTSNAVLVFNLGFDRKGPTGIHWAYFPQREIFFYRVGFYDNILNTLHMSLYVEIGFPSGQSFSDEEIQSHLERVLEDLRKVGILTDQRLVAWHWVLMDPAYVHITKASIADVSRKKRVLESRGIFSIGRYGSWTYCSIEDNIIEARALAEIHAEAWRKN
ncbi:MAG: FAD-dependent oxidoreductase [Sandaracinaceae bacterium]|nr:FAD-dependent oxidoreductase [Sandaracinaceae bacterium]MDW8246181.1 FAD-dependent oxidoreductase [Sandaracinaceae bacterium]